MLINVEMDFIKMKFNVVSVTHHVKVVKARQQVAKVVNYHIWLYKIINANVKMDYIGTQNS